MATWTTKRKHLGKPYPLACCRRRTRGTLGARSALKGWPA
jgi:hypothetical protein